MVSEIIRAYPFLGSFLYGHWEDVELGTTVFLIIYIGMLAWVLFACLGGIAGYALQSVALARIAKRQGAWRNIRIMACLPFARYFAIGKIAERCDVQQNSGRRLWGKILLIVCCIAIPIMAVTLLVAIIGLPGMQFVAMATESADDAIENIDSVPLQVILYVILIFMILPFLLLNLFSYETYAFVMVALPILGAACALIGVALLAAVRTLGGICYGKVLRAYFSKKTALILTVIGSVVGVMPAILFVASLKTPRD